MQQFVLIKIKKRDGKVVERTEFMQGMDSEWARERIAAYEKRIQLAVGNPNWNK